MRANKYRDHYCGTLTNEDVNKTIRVAGFIENIRDHGGVIFVDIRDQFGTLQLVSNDDTSVSGNVKFGVKPNKLYIFDHETEERIYLK